MTRFICSPSLLKTLPFFSGLSDSQLAAVLPQIRHRQYPPHSKILRAGDTADGLYVVLSGSVTVLHEDCEGRQFIASVVGVGQCFGEQSLIDGSPWSASVHSRGSCDILFLCRSQVLPYLEHSVGAAMSILKVVVSRLQEAHRKMEGLALKTVYERVAYLLLDASRYCAGERVVEVGSENIAAMVGASREMVSRVIGEMIENNVVRRQRRKLIVLDHAALARERARKSSREQTVARDPSLRQLISI